MAAACSALASAAESWCLWKDVCHGLFLKEHKCRCYFSVFEQVRFTKDSPQCQMCTSDTAIAQYLHQQFHPLVSARQYSSCLLRQDWTHQSKEACRFLPESLGSASVWTQAKSHSCWSCTSPKCKTQTPLSLGNSPESHCTPECSWARLR